MCLSVVKHGANSIKMSLTECDLTKAIVLSRMSFN